MRLLSYNIRYGGTGRERLIASVIRGCDADVVLLQEATHPHVVERLAAETGLKAWAARPGHSLAFLSRLEISHHEWHRPSGSRHPLLEVVPAGTELRLFGLHLSAVHSAPTEWRRVREMRALLRGTEHLRGGPHVLAGDFNTLAPGESLDWRRLPPRLRPFVWLSGGRVRYQTIPLLLGEGYADAYRLLHPQDAGHTFPTWGAHVRLDYFFIPARFADRIEDCRVVTSHPDAAPASDHFPLLAQLKPD
ncbi:MAG TPA: endonuclease/exonuclease/phosphatase family protein [Pyrinomonadaceae bacterium]|nr:endonuclease/exonuclease/phosphatase family protein [Pyrinomonadaceae bacterium]